MRWIASFMLLALVTPAVAATPPADKFKAAVQRKVAPPFGTLFDGKWKALCVCNSTDRVGVLETFGGIPNLGITCSVPTFSAGGEFASATACYDWTPVTK